MRHPFFALLILFGLILAGLAGYAIDRGSKFATAEAEQELIARAQIAREQASALLQRNDPDELQAFCTRIAAATNSRVTILLPNGRVVADSHEEPTRMDNHADRPEIAAALQNRLAPTRHYSYTLQAEMLYVAVPLTSNNRVIGVLRTALPTSGLERRLLPLHRGIVLTAGLLFILAAISAWLLSRPLRQALVAMRQWSDDLAAGKPLSKLTPAGPAKVADLALALDHLASKLSGQINQVSQQRNELEALFASMVEGVVSVDAEERFQSFNPAALALLCLDPHKAKGKSTLEAVRNLELQRFIRATLGSGTIQEGEIALPDATGANRAFYLRGVPLKTADDQIAGALVVISDVTNLRRLETVRRDFVANVSHELKTPITSIIGFIETLLDGAIDEPESARRFLTIIHQQAKRLHAIIEDLLALSRLEQETGLALSREPLRPRLAAAIANCQPAATAKAIAIQQECAEDVMARLNPALFEQALANLIDNAIKYSPTGSRVLISATATENEVAVAVNDQGVGIAPRDQSRIFERFFRVDKARSSTMGGTGLGLSIVKHIIQAHDGRVTLESALGQGSTFTIHLPQ